MTRARVARGNKANDESGGNCPRARERVVEQERVQAVGLLTHATTPHHTYTRVIYSALS